MMDRLPNLFWAPADRGVLGELRIRAHATGGGELVARHIRLEDAQAIIKAVRAHDALVDACRALVNRAGLYGVAEAHSKALAALALVEGKP